MLKGFTMRPGSYAALLVLAVLTVSMSACNKEVTADMVRSDPTPELKSVAMTHDQHENRKARAVDHTSRQIWDDLDSLLLINRPLRMTDYSMP